MQLQSGRHLQLCAYSQTCNYAPLPMSSDITKRPVAIGLVGMQLQSRMTLAVACLVCNYPLSCRPSTEQKSIAFACRHAVVVKGDICNCMPCEKHATTPPLFHCSPIEQRSVVVEGDTCSCMPSVMYATLRCAREKKHST